MKRTVVAVLTLVGLALVVLPRCATAAEDEIALGFHLKAGEAYGLLATVDQTIVQTVQGKKQNVAQKIVMGYTYHVLDVDEAGVATIYTSIDSILFRQDGPMGRNEYDSENPPDEPNPMLKGFAFLAGQGFSMKMAPNGTITDIEGVDKMFDDMIEALEMPDGPMKDAIVKSMKTQFGEKAMEEAMGKMTAVYPDEPVGVGDTWSQKLDLEMGIAMAIDATYTLKSVENGIATITIKAEIEPNPEAPPMEMGPMKMRYAVSGPMEGTYKVLVETGWFQRGIITQKLSGSITVTGLPGQTGDQTWPISIESVITMEPKEPSELGEQDVGIAEEEEATEE